jgi:hypothetical protein
MPLTTMTDVRPEAQSYSIKNVFPRRGEAATAQKIIDLPKTMGA